jgi:hypothetical protein
MPSAFALFPPHDFGQMEMITVLLTLITIPASIKAVKDVLLVRLLLYV